MKRLWKLSEFHKCLIVARFSLYSNDRITKPLVPIRFICQNATQLPHTNEKQTKATDLTSLVSDKWSYNSAETVAQTHLRQQVSRLKREILRQYEDVGKIDKVLEQNGVALFRRYSCGSAVVELLTQLTPALAMEVLEWRRKQLDYAAPMTVEEYSKGITIAGRLNSIDLAVELFKEASGKQLKSTSLFNALMTVYSFAGLPMKCQSLFLDLKMDPTCTPTIVTFNILIAAYGRMMLIDHMEATLREIRDLDLAPNIYTYRGLLVGYITAWMWDKMEKTYWAMKECHVKPDLDIYLLMIRGYALAGKLERMEAIYGMVRGHVDRNEIPLIRVMIRAYCKSSDAARVQKIEQLLQKIPENDYKPWLNVILIGLYAKEDLLDKMENSINEAFDHKIFVTSVSVMKEVISSYFRLNEVDKLAEFVQRVQSGGWRTCRSLYHCKMVMYDSQKRLSDMESVLDEMYRLNMQLSKKTYWILFKSYSKWGQKNKLEQILGRMLKNGYEVQYGTCSSTEYFC